MKVIRSITDMQRYALRLKGKGKSIGFVPTMGALHEGHLSLVRRCRKENNITVVSIFVNPIQFGPKEDFRVYPRNLKRDLALLRKEKVDVCFCPAVREMYPHDYRTYVAVEGLSERLCGATRPGHFKGVATVVARLLNIVQPRSAYFGQKDAQQCVVVKKMVKDLLFPVRIIVLSTVRESDGLAMSSRNAYLSRQERRDARVLPHALLMAKMMAEHKATNSAAIISRMRQLISRKKNIKIDYISLVHPETLEPVRNIKGPSLCVGAIKVGKTRLIDNLRLC